MGNNKKNKAKEKSIHNRTDMALTVGAKKLHEGRQFMYEQAKKYNSQFIDSVSGYCKDEFLENRDCPVCGCSEHINLFTKGGGRYVACKNCGMIFLNPVFTDKALENFYFNNSTTQSEVVINESDFYERIYNKGLASLSKYITHGTVMDVGCSSGFFLDVAKTQGWKTVGVELNNKEAKLAQKKHKVYNASIHKLELKEKCDVITMWDVFEHIKDGNNSLQMLSQKYLNKGGVIFLQVPNSKSLAARVLHEKCNMFDGIEHVNLYDPNTISLIAEKNGLNVLQIETVISEIPIIDNYLDYQDPYFGETKHSRKILGLIDEKTLHDNLLGYKMQVILRPA